MNTNIKKVLSITLISILLSACGEEDTTVDTKKDTKSIRHGGTKDNPTLVESGKKYLLDKNNAYNYFKIPKGKDVQAYGELSPSMSDRDGRICSMEGNNGTYCSQGWRYGNDWIDNEGNRYIHVETYYNRNGYIEFVLTKAKEKEKEKEIVSPSPYLQKIGSNGEELDYSSKNWKAVKINGINMMIENKSLIASLTEYNHDEAVNYCSNLIKAGYNDWKLANTSEIKTIFNILTYSDIEKPYLKNFFESTNKTIWLEDEHTGDYSGDYYYYMKYNNYISTQFIYKVNTFPAWCVRNDSN